MRHIFILISAISLLAFLGFGCGHLDGNNPTGVTGGGSDGYGSFGTCYCSDDYPSLVLGAWQQDGSSDAYNIVTFRADGAVKVDFYSGQSHNTQNGSFYISGSRMDINVSGWRSGSGTIRINNNMMTVAFADGTVTLHKAI